MRSEPDFGGYLQRYGRWECLNATVPVEVPRRDRAAEGETWQEVVEGVGRQRERRQ